MTLNYFWGDDLKDLLLPNYKIENKCISEIDIPFSMLYIR